MTGALQGSLPMDGGGLLGGLAKGLGSILGSLFGAGGPALAKGGVLSRGMLMPFPRAVSSARRLTFRSGAGSASWASSERRP